MGSVPSDLAARGLLLGGHAQHLVSASHGWWHLTSCWRQLLLFPGGCVAWARIYELCELGVVYIRILQLIF